MIELIRKAKKGDDSIISTICKYKDKLPDKIFEAADEYDGLPYRIGGDGKTSTDCGKFVQDVLCKLGFPIDSRDADDIWELFNDEGLITENYEDAEPGDILFFANTYGDFEEGTITHVGFFKEYNHMLHASSSRGVCETGDFPYYWNEYFDSVGKLNFTKF